MLFNKYLNARGIDTELANFLFGRGIGLGRLCASEYQELAIAIYFALR